MRIGVLTIAHSPVGRDSFAPYRQWLDYALEAERLGFWSIWTTQHHFGSERDVRPFGVSEEVWPAVDYDLAADALTMLTWVAGQTTRIRLGTAVSVPLWDDPLLLTERAAMLDVLSGGRLEWGVARGAGFREIEAFGVPRDDDASRRKFAEALTVMRAAWEQEPFSFEGEFYRFPPLVMTPRPLRQPAPLWVGASSNGTAEFAAQIGLPYATTTWPLVDLTRHKSKRDHYLAAAAGVGLDISRFRFPHFLFMYCGESDAEARESASRYLEQFQYILEAHYQHFSRGTVPEHYPRPSAAVAPAPGAGGAFFGAEQGLQNLREVTRTTLETQPIGSVDTVIERLKEYEAVLELNYLVVNIGWGGMPFEQTVASLRRFAEHAAPHFADRGAALARP